MPRLSDEDSLDDEADDSLEDDDDEAICPHCSGSGQGRYEGYTCNFCNGSGLDRAGRDSS